MTCPLCGIGILPGKICLGCGYDPSKPGVRPSVKPGPPPPRPAFRDAPPEKRAAKFRPRQRAQEQEDFEEEIEVEAARAVPVAAPVSAFPSMAERPKLPDETVQVTTQPSFEGHRVVAYTGLVVASVAVRVGEPNELSAEGQDIRRLTGGPIGVRLRKAIDVAIADLKMEAMDRKANAVVGIRLEILPVHGNMAILTAMGTAVTLET
jgi:uncharacterized protein YbjQ (UPF0145 family)